MFFLVDGLFSEAMLVSRRIDLMAQIVVPPRMCTMMFGHCV